jgi:hypothetical protein
VLRLLRPEQEKEVADPNRYARWHEMWVSLLPWLGWLLVAVMAVRLVHLETRRRRVSRSEREPLSAPDPGKSNEEST